MVTVTLQCSVFHMVTVTLNGLAPYGHCYNAVFSVLNVTVNWKCSARYCYCHTAVFIVPYGHCHFE